MLTDAVRPARVIARMVESVRDVQSPVAARGDISRGDETCCGTNAVDRSAKRRQPGQRADDASRGDLPDRAVAGVRRHRRCGSSRQRFRWDD